MGFLKTILNNNLAGNRFDQRLQQTFGVYYGVSPGTININNTTSSKNYQKTIPSYTLPELQQYWWAKIGNKARSVEDYQRMFNDKWLISGFNNGTTIGGKNKDQIYAYNLAKWKESNPNWIQSNTVDETKVDTPIKSQIKSLKVSPNYFARGFNANSFRTNSNELLNFNNPADVQAFQQFAASKGFNFKNSFKNGLWDGIAGSEVQQAALQYGDDWLKQLEANKAKENWLQQQTNNINEYNNQITSLQNQLNTLNQSPVKFNSNEHITNNIQRIGGWRSYGSAGEEINTGLDHINGTVYSAANLSNGNRRARIQAYKDALNNGGDFYYVDNFGITHKKNINEMSRRSFRHFTDAIGRMTVNSQNRSESQKNNYEKALASGVAGINGGSGLVDITQSKSQIDYINNIQNQLNQAQQNLTEEQNKIYTGQNYYGVHNRNQLTGEAKTNVNNKINSFKFTPINDSETSDVPKVETFNLNDLHNQFFKKQGGMITFGKQIPKGQNGLIVKTIDGRELVFKDKATRDKFVKENYPMVDENYTDMGGNIWRDANGGLHQKTHVRYAQGENNQGTIYHKSQYDELPTLKAAYAKATKGKDRYFAYKGKVYDLSPNYKESNTFVPEDNRYNDNKAIMQDLYGEYLGWGKSPKFKPKSNEYTHSVTRATNRDTSLEEQIKENPAVITQRDVDIMYDKIHGTLNEPGNQDGKIAFGRKKTYNDYYPHNTLINPQATLPSYIPFGDVNLSSAEGMDKALNTNIFSKVKNLIKRKK